MAIFDKVAQFISNLTGESNINPEMNLFQNGILSSLDVLDLLTFIEKEFTVEVPDDDIDADNFGTIRNIANLIESLNSR